MGGLNWSSSLFSLFVGFSSYYATHRKWDGAVIPQLAVYHFLFIKLQNQSATIFMFFTQGADGSRGRGLHGCAVLQEGADGRRYVCSHPYVCLLQGADGD
jgi:hypothetical protein